MLRQRRACYPFDAAPLGVHPPITVKPEAVPFSSNTRAITRKRLSDKRRDNIRSERRRDPKLSQRDIGNPDELRWLHQILGLLLKTHGQLQSLYTANQKVSWDVETLFHARIASPSLPPSTQPAPCQFIPNPNRTVLTAPSEQYASRTTKGLHVMGQSAS